MSQPLEHIVDVPCRSIQLMRRGLLDVTPLNPRQRPDLLGLEELEPLFAGVDCSARHADILSVQLRLGLLPALALTMVASSSVLVGAGSRGDGGVPI